MNQEELARKYLELHERFQTEGFNLTDEEIEKVKTLDEEIRAKSEIQALRYPKDTWDADDAKAHCKDRDGTFEAAGESEGMKREGPPNIEKRSFPVEEFRVIDDGGDPPKIVGYAAVFDKLSELMWGIQEKIAPGAFKNALKKSDARALFNHDPNIVLGRKSAKTLTLKEDDKGLYMKVSPPDTAYVRDVVLTPIKRGDIKEQSFAFSVKKDRWEEDHDKKLVTRTILEIAELYDVSPVTYPAYPDTTVAVRSMEEWRKAQNQPPASGVTSGSQPPEPGVTPEGWEKVTPEQTEEMKAELNAIDLRLKRLEAFDNEKHDDN